MHGLVSLLKVVVFMGVVDDDSDEVSFFSMFLADIGWIKIGLEDFFDLVDVVLNRIRKIV